MSDEKVSLEFLGEQMVRMRADIRDVRTEQGRLKSEQISMRADLSGVQTELVDLRSDVRAVDLKVDNLARRVDSLTASVDAGFNAVDARFDQVHETMATNLDIVLKAIDGKRS